MTEKTPEFKAKLARQSTEIKSLEAERDSLIKKMEAERDAIPQHWFGADGTVRAAE